MDSIIKRLFFLTLLVTLMGIPEIRAEEKGPEEQIDEPPQAAQFVGLHPMIIPVIQDRQLMGTYVIHLVIEATSVLHGDDIRKIQPLIRDALLSDIYSIFSLVWDNNQRIHLSDFKARLRHTAQKAVGKERVKDVLIQTFQRQESHRHRGYDYRK